MPNMSERSWITLHPTWYRSERKRIAKRYPELCVSKPELARGRLAYVGELAIRSSNGDATYSILLLYPNGTPYRLPQIIPINDVPEGHDWRTENVWVEHNLKRMPRGYRRHQMPEGNLCLIEAESHRRLERISGIEMLRRAEAVFRATEAGQPFPFEDTEEAELEAHIRPAGDILTGEVFYDDSLQGSGRFAAILYPDSEEGYLFYVPQTGTKRILLVGLYATSVGSTTGTIEVDWSSESSDAVLHTFPWLASGKFSLEQVSNNSNLKNLLWEGPWWDLPKEPEPPQKGKEVEELIAEAGVDNPGMRLQQMAGNLQVPSLAAFRYPNRRGGKEWLFLLINPRESPARQVIEKHGEGIKRDIMRDARVRALRHHPVTRPELELRNEGGLSANLDQKTILLVGAGALGGDVADTLGKAGVKNLNVVDPDIIRSGNVVRHVAGLRAVGLNKPDAVRQLIHSHNPFVDVHPLPKDITRDLERLERLVGEADIVISTVADDKVEMVLNEAAVRLETTAIYGRALRAGSVARVFRIRPGRDACKQCLALYHRDFNAFTEPESDNSIPDEVESVLKGWIDVPEAKEEIIGHECGNPILAGSAADLHFAANFTARAALDEFEEEPEWNVLTWSHAPLPKVHKDLQAPYSTVLQTIPPHPDCPICQRPNTQKVVISESALDAIIEHARTKPDVETGGVLIGFIDKNNAAVVVESTGAGPNATETKYKFERDADYVQDQLEDAAERLGEKGQYIGEWHSHLEREPSPSTRDVESLTGISEAPNYLTNEPIMLIAGLDPETADVENIYASCFPIGQRFKELELEVISDKQILL